MIEQKSYYYAVRDQNKANACLEEKRRLEVLLKEVKDAIDECKTLLIEVANFKYKYTNSGLLELSNKTIINGRTFDRGLNFSIGSSLTNLIENLKDCENILNQHLTDYQNQINDVEAKYNYYIEIIKKVRINA